MSEDREAVNGVVTGVGAGVRVEVGVEVEGIEEEVDVGFVVVKEVEVEMEVGIGMKVEVEVGVEVRGEDQHPLVGNSTPHLELVGRSPSTGIPGAVPEQITAEESQFNSTARSSLWEMLLRLLVALRMILPSLD